MQIKIHSTLSSERGKVITTSASNWAELKVALENEGISIKDKSFTLRVGSGSDVNKIPMKLNDTKIPTASEAVLFVFPEKVKSGVMAEDYGTGRQAVKDMIEDSVDEIKQYINEKFTVLIDEIEDVKDSVEEVAELTATVVEGKDSISSELDAELKKLQEEFDK